MSEFNNINPDIQVSYLIQFKWEVVVKSNSRHIVAGSSGFIGGHLVEFLTDKGHEVIGIDRLPNFVSSKKYRHIECDLNRDLKSLIDLVKKDSASKETSIWHLAANSDIAKGMKNPNIELEDTFMTTVSLSKVAKEIKAKRIIFSSTSAVYGDHQNRKLFEHQTELAPISYYGSLKLASESFLRAFSYESEIQLIIYRFPNVIGDRMTHGLLYDLPRKIDFEKKMVNILGNGLQKKPYYYVKDLVDSMVEISNKTKKFIDVFNLGPSDDGIEINNIVQLFLNKNFPEVKPYYGDTLGGWKGDVPIVNLSVDKMLRIIPQHNHSSIEAVIKTLDAI